MQIYSHGRKTTALLDTWNYEGSLELESGIPIQCTRPRNETYSARNGTKPNTTVWLKSCRRAYGSHPKDLWWVKKNKNSHGQLELRQLSMKVLFHHLVFCFGSRCMPHRSKSPQSKMRKSRCCGPAVSQLHRMMTTQSDLWALGFLGVCLLLQRQFRWINVWRELGMLGKVVNVTTYLLQILTSAQTTWGIVSGRYMAEWMDRSH